MSERTTIVVTGRKKGASKYARVLLTPLQLMWNVWVITRYSGMGRQDIIQFSANVIN